MLGAARTASRLDDAGTLARHGDSALDALLLQMMPPDFAAAVGAGRALLLVAFAQSSVNALPALLLGRLHGDDVHVRAGRGFADGGGIIGVILAAAALHAVRRDELAGNQARLQAQLLQPSGHMVGARTGLHRDEAALGKRGRPVEEACRRHGPCQHPTLAAACGLNLVNTLGQIQPDSGNPVHGLPPSYGCRLMTQTNNLGALTPFARGWEVPSYSFHLTSFGKPQAAGELQRSALWVLSFK